MVSVYRYWRISPNRLAHPGHINGPNGGNGYMALLRSGLWVWSKGHLIFRCLLYLPSKISFLFGPQTIAHIVSFKRTRHLPAHKTDTSFVRFNCAHVECKRLFFSVHSGCAQCVCLVAVLFTLHAASAWHSSLPHLFIFFVGSFCSRFLFVKHAQQCFVVAAAEDQCSRLLCKLLAPCNCLQ